MLQDNGRLSFETFIDTDTDGIFIPDTKYRLLSGTSKETMTNLIVAKRLSQKTSITFVFLT